MNKRQERWYKKLFHPVMKIENKEGFTEYNIHHDLRAPRKTGISAMMRIGNEEEFIEACIRSVLDFFDEIVVVLNNPTDNTEKIVRSIKSDKIKLYHYPFKLRPYGGGHRPQNPEDSARAVSYYYNWCLSQTSLSHVCKWDGDMVALSNLANFREQILDHQITYINGKNIAGPNLDHLSKVAPKAASEPRFFRVCESSYYKSGSVCEVLNKQFLKTSKLINKTTSGIREASFLHYKACKSQFQQRRMWPPDWKEMPHFTRIQKRFEIGPPYTGEQPAEIIKLLEKRDKQ